MKILVSNDDGINARGIHELVEALSEEAEIYVCAPDSERSASGHGITVSKPITGEETEFEGAAFAMKFSGTPADCVKLGLRILSVRGVKIDMVCSGINHGGNLGTDTLYSGTVSAAIEGSICGVPAVAVSINSHHPQHFGYARRLAAEAVIKSKDKISPDTVLNINVPALPDEEIKGLRYTSLGKREYREFFSPIELENGKTGYRYSGEPVIYDNLPDTIDVIAMQKGYATITPLKMDLTDYAMIEEIRKWRIDK